MSDLLKPYRASKKKTKKRKKASKKKSVSKKKTIKKVRVEGLNDSIECKNDIVKMSKPKSTFGTKKTSKPKIKVDSDSQISEILKPEVTINNHITHLHYKAEWIHRHFIYNKAFEPHTLDNLILYNLIRSESIGTDKSPEEICEKFINDINNVYGDIKEVEMSNGKKGYIYDPKEESESKKEQS